MRVSVLLHSCQYLIWSTLIFFRHSIRCVVVAHSSNLHLSMTPCWGPFSGLWQFLHMCWSIPATYMKSTPWKSVDLSVQLSPLCNSALWTSVFQETQFALLISRSPWTSTGFPLLCNLKTLFMEINWGDFSLHSSFFVSFWNHYPLLPSVQCC